MKTQKLKQGKKYNTIQKNYIKSVMYEFEWNEEIMVEEPQKNGTSDRTILHYNVKNGEKAYFSEEYLPVGMEKTGRKKPDITAILENSDMKNIKWFIYDMKDTVMNAQTALKLCSQWHSGIEHISNGYLDNFSGYCIESSIGVITRYRDKERLEQEIRKYTERIQNKNSLLTAKKGLMNIKEYKEKLKATQYLIEGIFVDYNEVKKEKTNYTINYIDLVTEDNIIYTAHMAIHS